MTMAIEPKSYPLEGKLEGISDKSLQEHRDTLYKGYVTQYNNIQGALANADRSKANPHFSEYGELKRRETWAHNGTILHEMYFENLGGKGTSPGPKTKAIIEKDFGSVDKFKEELLACGKIAPVGWAVWAYSFLDQKTHVYVIEQHQNHTPIMVIPLLILDEFEHAYFTDYGTKRPDYLNAFWANLNWETVEKRVTQWLAMTGALGLRAFVGVVPVIVSVIGLEHGLGLGFFRAAAGQSSPSKGPSSITGTPRSTQTGTLTSGNGASLTDWR
jgi:Fe-Mn family superoxide dismutase